MNVPRPRGLRVPALLAALVMSTIVLGAPAPAGAEPSTVCGTPGGKGNTATEGTKTITNIKRGAKRFNYDHGELWEISGEYPETLNFSRTLTYTNTYTSTVTVSSDLVSTALGFSVAEAQSTQVGASFPVPNDGRRWLLQAGTEDTPVTFDVELRCSGSWHRKLGTGSAVRTGRVATRHVPA